MNASAEKDTLNCRSYWLNKNKNMYLNQQKYSKVATSKRICKLLKDNFTDFLSEIVIMN
jgi:hypothetical protein